ncbi:uncharacterized protein KY384_009155 [Bacidia gigantensis]|uniref:uncharacterized protein n=1 Tax=Bacidia gigantensis TaxID=2732470 RepID=UPI001D04CEEB|nr:uncharacterized protein KY384_009155 [Bacidia gigantensis]KAG8525511.1 hypothetical protein KY384_009155 [Bacidia gigantensis]
MLRPLFPLSLAAAILATQTLAQTCDPQYLLCTPPDDAGSSNAAGTSNGAITDPSIFNWGPLQEVASLPIGKRHRLARRQEFTDAVCCSPDVDCLAIEDIPFCYVSHIPFTHQSSRSSFLSFLQQDETTTEFLLPDASYGFISNATYYGNDGTFVDYGNGYYSAADGSTGTFAAATATTGTAAASNSALVSVQKVASNPASAPASALHTAPNKAFDAHSASASMTGAGSVTASTPSPTATGNGGTTQVGEGARGLAGGAVAWLGGLWFAASLGLWLL